MSALEGDFIHVDDFVESGQTSKKLVPVRRVEHMSLPMNHDSTKGKGVNSTDAISGEWEALGLDSSLVKGLYDLGYTTPTDIQKASIPVLLPMDRDLLAAAQTGSGKTLAFGLPILNFAISRSESPKRLSGLVLVPTRELAMQVSKHLVDVSKNTGARVVPIIGGLSHLKQKRLLSMRTDIIVATPGRLWDICSQSEELLQHIRSTKFLVLDEADRMLQLGCFADLQNIIDCLKSSQDFQDSRRTMLFSATLIPDERNDLRNNGRRKKQKLKLKGGDSIGLFLNPFYIFMNS